MRTIWAVELTLYEIVLEKNGSCEGERIVSKESHRSHYDGSRSQESAKAAHQAADDALKATP